MPNSPWIVPDWPWWWPEGLWRRRRVSLLVPYLKDAGAPDRDVIWAWLETYWRFFLPDAEIIIGRDALAEREEDPRPFSKSRAVNYAAKRARGDIYVIVDADTYFDADIVMECAERIRAARRWGEHLWFIPYRHIYRLRKETSERILSSDPTDPLRIPSPPPPSDVESTVGSMHGHRFGAMIQIVPARGFWEVGGMDPTFEGWGGEDVSFVRAMDTLWGSHQTTPNDVLHIWHKHIGDTHQTRMWENQAAPGNNWTLASRYNMATGDPRRMRALVKEGLEKGHP